MGDDTLARSPCPTRIGSAIGLCCVRHSPNHKSGKRHDQTAGEPGRDGPAAKPGRRQSISLADYG